MMTCRELINEFLLDYVDGTLAGPAREEFDRHLKACAACVAYVESYRQTIRLGRVAMEPSAPPPAELIEAVLRARQPPNQREA